MNYLVRVEIYDADYNQYDLLHEKMLAIGFRRTLTRTITRKVYDLPDGTYFGKSSLSPIKICAKIKSIAEPLSRKSPSIIVCRFYDDDCAFALFPTVD
ncbi:DUF2622 domain-containing protein [Xenorhabdus entomophaga]|uniref:DUF2622 domain-containing protein n=1 Tax=Xenorhabdus entomophaga TaxID=3136257 RepID=UPI0030F4161D